MNHNPIFHMGRRIMGVSLCLIIALILAGSPENLAASPAQADLSQTAASITYQIDAQESQPTFSHHKQVTIGDEYISGETTQFALPERTDDTVTITHSVSQNIIAGNSVACSSDGGVSTTENGFLRTFVLEDFSITDDFGISEVSFGVEGLTGSGDTVTVNLYTLNGTFIYANMTLVGSASQYLDPMDAAIIQVPVEATIPAGSTLVVEVDWPDTTSVSGFFIGSNNLGQTAPSYIRSSSCGLDEPTELSTIGFPEMHIVMNVTGSVSSTPPDWYKTMSSCIPAEEAPFAYINQPWSFLEGVASPGALIQASLKRGTSTISTASTNADTLGWFSTDFLIGGNHVEIQPGDQVLVSGGGLDATLIIPDIVGSIDPDADSVAGQISGVSLPALGDICVRMPAEIRFTAGKTWFDSEGRFGIEFAGVVNLGVDHLAQVVYEDPNGNYVVQVLYPEGLNPRALINESRVEGVTRPGSLVTVRLYNADGLKGWAETSADQTGFYSTEVFLDGQKVRFELGDQVVVNKLGHSREITLSMYHISHIHPWDEQRVFGTIYDANIPAEGSQGRVDVWNANEQHWYTQYAWIEPDGQYGADFNGITNLEPGSPIRVWATAADGSQQAALGWDLSLGVSTSEDYVWGYTTADREIQISLYRSLDGNTPVDLIGSATTMSQLDGSFFSAFQTESTQVDIAPTNAIVVDTGEQIKTLFIGEVDGSANVTTNILTIQGPVNATVHIEGHHPYTSAYVWQEVTLDAAGTAEADLSDFNILPGDIFDLTCYFKEQGLAVHVTIAAPGQPNPPLFLPLIVR